MPATFQEGISVPGPAIFTGPVTLPANSFGDGQANPNSPINTTKLRHQYLPRVAQAHGSAAAAERRVVHVAKAAGTVQAFRITASVAPVGDSTVTADLRKNGTSVLQATIQLTSSQAAFAIVAAVIQTAAYVAGDVFEVVVTVSAGTGTLPQGVAAVPEFREDPGA